MYDQTLSSVWCTLRGHDFFTAMLKNVKTSTEHAFEWKFFRAITTNASQKTPERSFENVRNQ